MNTTNPSELLRVARAAVDRSIDAKSRLGGLLPTVVDIAEVIRTSLDAGGKVLLFGNGGSAADAQHIAAEFVGRYARERAGLAAVALTTDTSALTAIANDYGYDEVFRRQVDSLVQPHDVAIGISTSGNSPSVLNGLDAARKRGAVTVALTGGRRSKCHELADHVLAIPDVETARIQECHLLLGHVICELLDVESVAPVLVEDSPAFGVSESLRGERARWRECGRRVVLTSGVFDLFHAGHLASLEAARAMGDVLVVAVNGDRRVEELKGPGRPVIPAQQRASLIAALRCVDRVVLFDEDDASEVIEALQPDVWCKGADYATVEADAIPEAAVLRAYGGQVAFIDLVPGVSTSTVIERLCR
jgi:phosphoheptose isomerase